MQQELTADPIRHALSGNPHFASHRLQIENAMGRIVIKGTVGSYFHKQMAQEALRRVDGVHEIENQLEVDRTA